MDGPIISPAEKQGSGLVTDFELDGERYWADLRIAYAINAPALEIKRFNFDGTVAEQFILYIDEVSEAALEDGIKFFAKVRGDP